MIQRDRADKGRKLALLPCRVIKIVVPCCRVYAGISEELDAGDRFADDIVVIAQTEIAHEIVHTGISQQLGAGYRQVDPGGPGKILVANIPGRRL